MGRGVGGEGSEPAVRTAAVRTARRHSSLSRQESAARPRCQERPRAAPAPSWTTPYKSRLVIPEPHSISGGKCSQPIPLSLRPGRNAGLACPAMDRAAVVLMAYGSPERLADVPAYYADIRGGRPIRPELLDDLVERYRKLGIEEQSPLNAITEETRAALQRDLGDVPVFTGMKHWTPRIAEAAERALATGAQTVVGLVLAPHFSSMSIAGYRRQLEEALAGRAELAFVESWHDDPGFVDVLADRVRGTDAHVVFTAHSLPARILGEGDPYKAQLLETSQLVAERAALRDWSFSFQRESQTGEPWLGPDILDHLQ